MDRRNFLKAAFGGVTALVISGIFKSSIVTAQDTNVKKLTLSDEQWKARLTSAQYNVLRKEGTERPFSSPLLDEHRDGIFSCVACDLPLFPSKFKFESGTGWPSFYDTIAGNIATKTDTSFFTRRTEYHCVRCGGHHGHVFEDGPKPTGLRYCNNGVALKFIPAKT